MSEDDPVQRALTPLLSELDVEQMADNLRAAPERQGFQEELLNAEQAMKDARAEYVWLERIRERRTAGFSLKQLEVRLAESQEAVNAMVSVEESLRKDRAGAILQVQEFTSKAQGFSYTCDSIKAWNADSTDSAADLKKKLEAAQGEEEAEAASF